MAQNVAGYRNDAAEQEGNAPRPVPQLRVCEHGGRRGNAGGQQHARGCADIRDAAGDAATSFRRGLDQICDRAGKLAADGKTLQHAHEEQQQRSADADCLIGGEKGCRRRRKAHQYDRVDQHGAPSGAVAQMTEYGTADRARRETNGKAAVSAD
jgi:hypothetical protein